MSGDVNQPAIIVTNSEEPWNMAFFNGAAIMDDIPVSNRDIHDQIAFRGGNQSKEIPEVKVSHIFHE